MGFLKRAERRSTIQSDVSFFNQSCIVTFVTIAPAESPGRDGLKQGVSWRKGFKCPRPNVIITAIESGFGFLLTSTVLYLVLSQGRKTYHYLFAAILLIYAIWDLGIFLTMIRNDHGEELDIIGRVVILPCTFLPALIFHFANLYTGRPIMWAIALIWGLIAVIWVPILAGAFYRIEGFYAYDWGNIFRVAPSVFDPMISILK